ncbi:ABC transporter substrate-binding protein [Aestuariibius sp. 2305UL40-4]|uniref:ABC transporter substrate-binding protein n=1 Tax=Aestuariibius violaceus TaxID=3234132 RepID=UPI00345E6026
MTVLTATRLGAIAILLSTAALADGHLDEMGPEDLLPLAQDEGTVTVYSFTSRIGRVETAFEEAYPGIDLQGFDISSTEQIARLQAEAQAGVTNADVIYISDTPVVLTELLETGIIAPYVPPRVAGRVAEQYQSPLLAQRLSTKVLMYNEEAHPDGAPVSNLWQLTTGEWNGRVVMVDPLQRGDYLDLMTEIVLRSDEMAAAYEAQFGQAIDLAGAANAGEKFIIDLFANDVILVSSTDDVNVAVGAVGQETPPVGFTSYSDRRDNEEEGWALQVANGVEPAPGIIFPAVLALAAEPNNPAAARLVIDFLMGDESETGGPGLAPFYVAGDYVTRTDIPPHPDAVPLGDFTAWRIAPAETATIRAEIGDLILTLQ